MQLAVPAHLAHVIALVVLDRRQIGGKRPGAGQISRHGRALAQRFVRADKVVLVALAVEGALAGVDGVEAGAVEQFAFERTVKPLILALRLGVKGPAVTDADTQARQPDL